MKEYRIIDSRNSRKRPQPFAVLAVRTERLTPFSETGRPRRVGLAVPRVRAIIGKGGLLRDSVDAMQSFGGVYLAIVGGAAALETLQIEEIEDVWWEDLMPECFWKFRVKDLGPLIVAIDSHGNNLYARVQQQAAAKIASLLGS